MLLSIVPSRATPPGCKGLLLDHTYICMRGEVPSLNELMLALSVAPWSASSCASARRGSPSTPPRP
jgi:hypothetical protein